MQNTKYKKAKMQKYKKYNNTKTTWVPAINTKTQNKREKTAKPQKNRRKDTCASNLPQNFQMIYRDSTKNKIKNMGRLLLRFAN